MRALTQGGGARQLGSAEATGVLTSILLPAEMTPVKVDGPVKYRKTNRQIDFDSVAKIGADGDTTFELVLQASTSGDARLQVQVQSDQMKRPLRREISTMIFGDDE